MRRRTWHCWTLTPGCPSSTTKPRSSSWPKRSACARGSIPTRAHGRSGRASCATSSTSWRKRTRRPARTRCWRRSGACWPPRKSCAVAPKKRRRCSARATRAGFSRGVAAELAALGMGRTEISVRFGPVPEGGIAAEGEVLGPRGLESAELLLSPNPGEELRPLARIASGGELSRVLLAVKRVLADADDVDTYLFDEVDAGIGGATADAVGRALLAVAHGRQVICITHLPQIAVFAERHQVAEKEVVRGRTHSRVAAVDGEARVQELARLLSGRTTQVALEHARELLAKARARPSGRARRAGYGRLETLARVKER